MTRKKRIIIAITITVVILLILITTFILLYLNTDLFKSNQTLFVKYLGENLENVKEVENIIKNSEYDEQLSASSYNDTIEVTANYTQNVATTEENSNNPINQLKITIDGQTDNKVGYDYRDIKLLKNDAQVAQAEYLHSESNYGIKFSDLFNQYIVSENANLKELFKKLGYSDEQIQNIPDTVEMNMNFLNDLKFTDEELEIIKEKYIGIISQDISETNFGKESNQIININGKDYSTNAYVLTLTKEQLNNIYINLLQNIKQDEIILAKLDIIQNKINEITLGNNNINMKEDIISRIDRIIQRINQNNIGSDETKIIVYENEGQTIRTRVETQEYQTNIDFLNIQSNKFYEILIANGENEKYKATLNYNDNNLSIAFQNNNSGTVITFEKNEEVNNQTRKQNYEIVYQINNNKVIANISRNTEIVQNIENMQKFNDENAVILYDLEDTQAQEIINTVRTGVETELETVRQEIEYQNIEQMLKDIGLIKDTSVLGSTGITQTERSRFNATFELLKGENLTGDNVTSSIQTIKNNIGDMEIVSNSELRLSIVRNQTNEEVVNTLTTYLEDNRSNRYNINVEYDENGLVNQLVLTIVNNN